MRLAIIVPRDDLYYIRLKARLQVDQLGESSREEQIVRTI